MEPLTLFQYLEAREKRPVPFLVKWLTGTLSAEDLKIKGHLFLGAHEAEGLPRLPDNLWVTGNLTLPEVPRTRRNKYVPNSPEIFKLPNNLRVDGDLDVAYSPITYHDLPEHMRVKCITIIDTPLEASTKIEELFERFPKLEVIRTGSGNFLRSEVM